MTPKLQKLIEQLEEADVEELHGGAAIHLSNLICEAIDALRELDKKLIEHDVVSAGVATGGLHSAKYADVLPTSGHIVNGRSTAGSAAVDYAGIARNPHRGPKEAKR